MKIPIWNADSECFTKHDALNTIVKPNPSFKKMDILFKQIYTIDGYGHECRKKMINIITSTNFFGARSKETSYKWIKLGKMECD